jgi:hypothetical protein
MKTSDELVQSIDKRLRELNDEIKMLDAARVALDGHENRPSMGAQASVTYPRKFASPRELSVEAPGANKA